MRRGVDFDYPVSLNMHNNGRWENIVSKLSDNLTSVRLYSVHLCFSIRLR